MIYLKSALAGLGALVLALMLLLFFGPILVSFFDKSPPGINDPAMSWDLRSLISNSRFMWIFGVYVFFAFGIGFYWRLRRGLR
jgi:hypothetical protein